LYMFDRQDKDAGIEEYLRPTESLDWIGSSLMSVAHRATFDDHSVRTRRLNLDVFNHSPIGSWEQLAL